MELFVWRDWIDAEFTHLFVCRYLLVLGASGAKLERGERPPSHSGSSSARSTPSLKTKEHLEKPSTPTSKGGGSTPTSCSTPGMPPGAPNPGLMPSLRPGAGPPQLPGPYGPYPPGMPGIPGQMARIPEPGDISIDMVLITFTNQSIYC